ncbi:MAG: class I SAM-dependent methyltransferase [Chloroflexi bacterium]|nr:class I SAM-dependent methyltransferase [Chloroflexota bacterium]
MTPSDLDYAFLKYIGVNPSVAEAVHRFYLPFLAEYPHVLDLGSGMGGFVKLLCDAGKDAYGIDSDPGCVAEARALGVPVVDADIIDHLRSLEEGSLDAIFSAHLVEHLPYNVVLDLIQLAHRALRPGGRLILATPNPRALISHLEFYHYHFGHVAMYQPELLAFFMTYCGFSRTQTGENPDTSPDRMAPNHPLAGLSVVDEMPPLRHDTVLPRPSHLIRRLIWYPKMWLIHWLVQPYTDRVMGRLSTAEMRLQLLAKTVNRPFECYAIGDKALEETSGADHHHP